MTVWLVCDPSEVDTSGWGDATVVRFAGWKPTPAELEQVTFYCDPSSDLTHDEASAMTGLRYLQVLSSGYDDVLPYLPEHIGLCNGRGAHTGSTAEAAVLLAMSAQRRLPMLLASQGCNEWSGDVLTESLADTRIAIVGAGDIARKIAAILQPLATDVSMFSRTPTDDVYGLHELENRVAGFDLVVLAIALGDLTTRLFDRNLLSRMKDGALLVNVARGGLVDTDALVAELASGRLRAALDVTEPEPLPAGHPLWSSPGVILTPHVGSSTTSAYNRKYRLLSDQVRRLTNASLPINVVREPTAHDTHR